MPIQIPAIASTSSISSQALALASRELRQRRETPERSQRASGPAQRVRQLQSQGQEVQRLQDQLSERVEKLVQNMKTLAERLSSGRTSPPQRTVLVGRFNDLQRRVDELDGIVVSEGQTTQGEEQVGRVALSSRNRFRALGETGQKTSAPSPATETAQARAPETAPAQREFVRQRFSIGVAGRSASKAVDLVV